MNFNLFHPAKSVIQLGYSISQIRDAMTVRGLFIRRFNHIDFNFFLDIITANPDQAVPRLICRIMRHLKNNEF